MKRDQAFEIINEYFESWIKKDINMFSKVVHEAASTGAVMEGRSELVSW